MFNRTYATEIILETRTASIFYKTVYLFLRRRYHIDEDANESACRHARLTGVIEITELIHQLKYWESKMIKRSHRLWIMGVQHGYNIRRSINYNASFWICHLKKITASISGPPTMLGVHDNDAEGADGNAGCQRHPMALISFNSTGLRRTQGCLRKAENASGVKPKKLPTIYRIHFTL
jgi:hypothetical protein